MKQHPDLDLDHVVAFFPTSYVAVNYYSIKAPGVFELIILLEFILAKEDVDL